MSAIPLTLLTAAAVATVLGGAAVHTAHGVRRELVALRSELASAECAEGHPATVRSLLPHARAAHGPAGLTSRRPLRSAEASNGAAEQAGPTDESPRADGRHEGTSHRTPLSTSSEEIRAAVAEALAEERERELAEARAFWAAQEARGMGRGNGSLLAGHGVEYEVSPSAYEVSPSASELDDALLDALAEGHLDGRPPHGDLPDQPSPPELPDSDLPGLPEHEGEIFIPRQNRPDAAPASPTSSAPHDPGSTNSPRGRSLQTPGTEPDEAGDALSRGAGSDAPTPGGRIPEPRTPGGRHIPGHIPEGDRIPAERKGDGMGFDNRRSDERGRPFDGQRHADEEAPKAPNAGADGEAAVPSTRSSRENPDRTERPEPAERDESSELAAARRRHPSHPDFDLDGERRSPSRPGGSADSTPGREEAPAAPVPEQRDADARGEADATPDHERTVKRLTELAQSRVPLTDVRPGPLGTLDVYLFQDGSTVCLSPGHSEVSEQLARALRAGDDAFLLGGSSVAGAFALTFSRGESETVYLLAERVIASP